LSLKPNVAYLVLNFCALWKKHTTLPSLAYAGMPYQVLGARSGALCLTIACTRSAMTWSGSCIAAMLSSTSLSPSAFARAAFRSRLRTASRIRPDVAALALVLAVAFRALLLPAVATLSGMLVAASTFGVLELLFGRSNPPLGGPGYLDPITIISVFALALGITVVSSAVLLARARQAFVAGAGSREAVRSGLRETTAATTGAGLLMIAALIPLSLTQLLNVRALGIGLAVAVLLHVLIVRRVLLPAVAVGGRRPPAHEAADGN